MTGWQSWTLLVIVPDSRLDVWIQGATLPKSALQQYLLLFGLSSKGGVYMIYRSLALERPPWMARIRTARGIAPRIY